MPMLKRAVALGFFDGIHIGHAALMQRLLDVCKKTDFTPTVMTFDTLPQNLLESNQTPAGKTIPLINSPEDRVGLIERLFGIDNIIFLHFDKTTASMPWSEFIDRLIIDYNVHHIIAGHNFKFGSGAKGNFYLLKQQCTANNIGCDIIPDVILDGIVSSSTYIRELLLKGEVERANTFLGHPHVLTDVVRSGQQLGKTLGTPTLNMRFPPDVLIPAYGVYATKVYVVEGATQGDGSLVLPLTGVTNIGTRPTVDNSGQVTVETHIPGFHQDLYGSKVRIEFHKYLRPEMKFDSTDQLKTQIQKDCETATHFFDL